MPLALQSLWPPPALKCAAFHRIGRTLLEINPLVQTLKDITARTDVLRGYL